MGKIRPLLSHKTTASGGVTRVASAGSARAEGAKEPGATTPYSAGYRLETWRPDAEVAGEPLAVNFWYPSRGDEAPLTYGNREAPGHAARGAPLVSRADGFPVAVVSHGLGGAGVAHAYLGEHLARRGWVVVAPDYPDEYEWVSSRPDAEHPGPLRMIRELRRVARRARERTEWRNKYGYRPKLFRALLDWTLEGSRFADEKRAAGYAPRIFGIGGPWALSRRQRGSTRARGS